VARQFIYHMHGLSKAYPNGRKVLENINLSFYPDAKIGVLGPNGSGKSTLLRIMAGLDKEFNGEAWVAEGASVGFLSQEPQLDAGKDVMGNVMEGVAAKKAVVDRYNELMISSMRRISGIWRRRWSRRWMPCAVRPAMRRFPACREASAVGWR
jgi:ATPase subunit of ABC transporter with duplicated ATPase domains